MDIIALNIRYTLNHKYCRYHMRYSGVCYPLLSRSIQLRIVTTFSDICRNGWDIGQQQVRRKVSCYFFLCIVLVEDWAKEYRYWLCVTLESFYGSVVSFHRLAIFDPFPVHPTKVLQTNHHKAQPPPSRARSIEAHCTVAINLRFIFDMPYHHIPRHT